MTRFVPVIKIEGKFKNYPRNFPRGTKMEMMDPLDESSETEVVESKVLLSEHTISNHHHQIESDDESNVVDHLSPQTLLETPESEVQYSLRSPEGMVTYRVLQVEEGADSVPQMVSTGANFPNSHVQQVIASNINGQQVYVIGNPSEVFATQAGTRAIAPRSTVIDSSSSVVGNIKRRDDRRRATHNEVERRRRDKINNWITKLSKIIPETSPNDMKGNGQFDGQSKGGILAKACEYILELRDNDQKCDQYIKENKQLNQDLDLMTRKNGALEQENHVLRDVLKKNGIAIPAISFKIESE